MRGQVLISLAVLVGGCAAELGNDRCSLAISVTPANPVAGQTLTATVSANEPGVITPTWTITQAGTALDCTDGIDGQCDGLAVDFLTAVPGPVEVRVTGTVDAASCGSDTVTINVMDPGANTASYRVVTTPLDVSAPVDERIVVIPGGADYDVGELRLDSPVAISGSVISNGSGVAAHIRLVSSTGVRDVFANAAAGFSADVGPDPVAIEVFPADLSLPPIRFDEQFPATVSDLVVGNGTPVGGQVSDPGGAFLGGARVSLDTDGLPSSIGTTDGGGVFSVGARGGTNPIVTVSAPATSGLPSLEGAIASYGASSSISIVYDSGLVTGTRTFTAPVGGARVTFISDELADAGAASVDGGQARALTGRVRRSVVADGAGGINIALTDGMYTIIVSSPGATPTVIRRQVDAGVSPVLAAAAPAQWTAELGTIQGALAGARVVFRPRGELALVPGAAKTAVSDALGVVTVDLAADSSYEVQIEPDAMSGRRVFLGEVTSAAPGQTTDAGTISIPSGQLITGEVILASGATASAHVAFFCTSCPTPDVPVAESVTNATGAWEIVLPDSGTQ